jgi:hypothetical protein
LQHRQDGGRVENDLTHPPLWPPRRGVPR